MITRRCFLFQRKKLLCFYVCGFSFLGFLFCNIVTESNLAFIFNKSVDGSNFEYPTSGAHGTFQFQLRGAIPSFSCPPARKRFDENADYFEDQQQENASALSIAREITVDVETSVLHAFSPFVNEHVKRMFNRDIVERERWFTPYVFQAACLPRNYQTLQCALRVWFALNRFHDFRNRFQDSYVYVLELDGKLKYKDNSGRLLAIPSPVNELWFTGPEDPRLLVINGSVFVNYIAGQFYDDNDATVRHQFLWSIDRNVVHDLEVDDYVLNNIEKNWSPLITEQADLYFIYQLIPVTRILKCAFRFDNASRRRVMKCAFEIGKPDDPLNTVKTKNLLLRGGSPFVHYEGDYYLAATHSVQWLAKGRVYAAQLTLLNLKAKRIVFTSSPILIDRALMNGLKGTDSSILKPFFYARSLQIETGGDSVILAGGVNDEEAFIVRLSGIKYILQQAIKTDRMLNLDSTTCDTSTSAYERMLLHSYTALENWIRSKNLEVIDKYL